MAFETQLSPSLSELMNQRAMQSAQLYGMGQEGQLRRMQIEQAMQEREQKGRLRDLMTQAAQGAVTQPQALPDLLGVSSYRPDVANQIWGVGAAPEQAAATQQAWEQRANIPTMSQGGFDPGKFSELLMRSGDPDAITQGMALKKSLAGEGFTLGEGQVRYGAGGQEVARGPAKAPKEISRWSEPFGMGGATVQKNLDTGEIRTAVSRQSPGTQVIFKQEGEESKAVGKGFGEQYMDIQKSGLQAGGKIARFDRMSNLMQGIETGKLTPTTTQIAALADSFGIVIDKNLGTKQAIEALSNELALELRNPSGGAGMPGAMSDADRRFLAGMAPGLSKTPEGNRLIIETAKKLAKRDQEVAAIARKYRMKNKTIDEGFYEELAAYSEKNPLFTANQPTRPPLSSFRK